MLVVYQDSIVVQLTNSGKEMEIIKIIIIKGNKGKAV